MGAFRLYPGDRPCLLHLPLFLVFLAAKNRIVTSLPLCDPGLHGVDGRLLLYADSALAPPISSGTMSPWAACSIWPTRCSTLSTPFSGQAQAGLLQVLVPAAHRRVLWPISPPAFS